MELSEDEFVEGLLRRVRHATSEAERVLARSERLVTTRRLLRDRTLFRRCAWCERVAIGPSWIEQEQLPRFVPDGIVRFATHTICPDCEARLVHEGKSHATPESGTA